MNVEALAFEASQKQIASEIELPLSTIGDNFEAIAENHPFRPFCMTRKFKTIEQIREVLKEDANFYLYKLYQYHVYGIDLQQTGEKTYNLRYCVRAKEN